MKPATNFEPPNTLSDSIEKARKFIIENQKPNGLWSDFLTLAGESTFWVSGYIGYALISLDESPNIQNSLEKAGSNILEHQNFEGGWGYGQGVPSDADSTSWSLLFLSKLRLGNSETLPRALSFLQKHQSSTDGGFRTYANPRNVGRYMMIDESVSFEGWASSQMCVTAVAAQALLENHSKKGLEEALSYIREGQTSKGYWNPYWWTGKIYATANCIKALKANNKPEDITLIKKAQTWIAQTQLNDGSWSDSSNQESGWTFSTALALSGLLSIPQPKFKTHTENGIKWLLETQLIDGSWTPNHILRIPPPWTKDPWNLLTWKKDGKAINAAIKDQNRLFTTATAFSTLNQYRMKLTEGEKL